MALRLLSILSFPAIAAGSSLGPSVPIAPISSLAAWVAAAVAPEEGIALVAVPV